MKWITNWEKNSEFTCGPREWYHVVKSLEQSLELNKKSESTDTRVDDQLTEFMLGKIKGSLEWDIVEKNVREYERFLKWLEPRKEQVQSSWCLDEDPEDGTIYGCNICKYESCDYCLGGLIFMDGREDQFLSQLKKFIRGTVEELYLHPNWAPDELEEYGEEMGFLVNLYFENQLDK